MLITLESDEGAGLAGERVERARQRPGTWAGGTTRTIYAYPPDAMQSPAQAQIWVGTAVIQQPAPYSYFPDRLRIHVPIQGNGIQLYFHDPDELVTLATFAQHRFDGARPVRVELRDGPIVAFNLIIHPSVSAEVQVLEVDGDAVVALPNSVPPQATAGVPALAHVVYAISGALAIAAGAQPAVQLDADDAFVMRPYTVGDRSMPPARLRVHATAADLVVATLLFHTNFPL